MYPGHPVANLKNLRVSALAFLLCTIVSANWLVARSQEIPRDIKFDAFEEMMTDNVLARLDLFAQELGKDERVSGFIVAYRREDQLPGSFLREIYGYRDYLVNKRGVDPDRTTIIDGGTGEKRVTELWLVSKGANPPLSRAANLEVNAPVQFDGLPLGHGCVGEYTLELQEPRDALRFFAGALRSSPTAKGFIIVHPSARESLNKAQELARSSKQSLVKEYAVAAQRIVISLAAPRPCREIDFWLAPSSLAVPKNSNIELLEAEQNKYTIRRLELIGNEHIRDQVLRRRLWALQEGDIFTKDVLTKSLASLNRPADIKTVRLDDVDVRLDRAEKTVDLLIVINERRRRR